jgi:hypothetical protein
MVSLLLASSHLAFGLITLPASAFCVSYPRAIDYSGFKAARQPHHCPQGHGLTQHATRIYGWKCSECTHSSKLAAGSLIHVCKECDLKLPDPFQLCTACFAADTGVTHDVVTGQVHDRLRFGDTGARSAGALSVDAADSHTPVQILGDSQWRKDDLLLCEEANLKISAGG